MTGLARTADAAANRACEGLRVMEDLARYVLDNEDLAARSKVVRHGVRAQVAALAVDGAAMLASRDVGGDVGRRTSTPSEGERSGAGAIALAAAKRAAEGLRTLEECAKAMRPPAGGRGETPAAAIEQLRYQAYAIEQELVLQLSGGRARQYRLCVLMSERLCGGRDWLAVAEAAIAGGADCLQLREKSLADRELLARARSLVEVCRPHGVACFINDRADVALLAGADGVHLGQQDLPLGDVRALVGRSLLIGVSTACMDQARAAVRAGADLCGLGPMYPSDTKPKGRLSGPEYLREYLAEVETARVPHLAISGIDAARAGELSSAGCRGVAVSSAVCGAPDPEAACRGIVEALARAGG